MKQKTNFGLNIDKIQGLSLVFLLFNARDKNAIFDFCRVSFIICKINYILPKCI